MSERYWPVLNLLIMSSCFSVISTFFWLSSSTTVLNQASFSFLSIMASILSSFLRKISFTCSFKSLDLLAVHIVPWVYFIIVPVLGDVSCSDFNLGKDLEFTYSSSESSDWSSFGISLYFLFPSFSYCTSSVEVLVGLASSFLMVGLAICLIFQQRFS